jgi:hypothetical protein
MVQGSATRRDRAGERGSGGDWKDSARQVSEEKGRVTPSDRPLRPFGLVGRPTAVPHERKVVSGHAYAIPAPPVVRLAGRKTNTDYPPGR